METTTFDLAQMMGSECTETDAENMAALLKQRGIEDPSEVPEREWSYMVAESIAKTDAGENSVRCYRIVAEIDPPEGEGYDGYSVYDYFDTNITGFSSTREEAEEIASAGYKGPDVDGVGCTWRIVEVWAQSYEPTGN